MYITTKGRNALKIMIDLAQREGEGYISLAVSVPLEGCPKIKKRGDKVHENKQYQKKQKQRWRCESESKSKKKQKRAVYSLPV